MQPAAITTLLGGLIWGVATAHAQVNGNVSISAPAFGLPLTVRTSSQFGGAVSSIRWGNKEFINDWDHGRQLGANSYFFNRFECYNPYETGSKEDRNLSTSSSQLLAMQASGNGLESTTRMAWYLSTRETRPGFGDLCGDPNNWLPTPPYTGPLSNYQLHKTVTIGFAGIPNVIEYLSELYIPEQVQKGSNQITAVMPYDFSSIWAYDVVSKDYRTIRALGGEDENIKVAATSDGSYALGFYSPEVLQPYGDGSGTANWWYVVPPNPFYPDPNNPSLPDPNYACVHIGSMNRYESFGGPGYTNDRAYLVIGTLSQVKETLGNLHNQFRALDPEVFNWREYVAINGLEGVLATSSLRPLEAAENHWLTQGITQGLTASRTFSPSAYLELNPDVANLYGPTNYQGAIDHYISFGRAEGRGTVAGVTAGMQHRLQLTNGTYKGSGQNVYGQLGDESLAGITEVAAGDYTSLGVKADGSLWVWGSNQYGALGDGTTSGNIGNPVQVPIPNRITTPSRAGKHAVAVGTSAYAAIDTEGQVWTWGANWNGRLGDGTTTSRYTPARVKKSASPDDYLTGIVSIAAGGGTMAAIDADGMIWTWGSGTNGALGNGSTQDSAYPVQVLQAGNNNASTPVGGVVQVACGSSGFCIALIRQGEVLGWGSNEFSQLGIAPGGALSIATPITINGLAVDAIAVGSAHVIAHSSDGNVYGWGYNGRGQLGTGSTGVAQFPPVAMNSGPDGMNGISDLAAGGNFSIMIRNSDRAVFVAGDNQSGQLGISGTQPQYLPVNSSVVASVALDRLRVHGATSP
jgi:alpha-tubulin suppressor-like RCC1 family protein